MSQRTLILRFAAVLLCALSLAIFSYFLSCAPSREPQRHGLRGLKRTRALNQNESWARVEPLVRWLGARFTNVLSEEQRAALDARLVRAGDYMGLSPEDVVGASIFLCLVGGGAGYLCGFALGYSPPLLAVFGAALGLAMLFGRIDDAGQKRLVTINRNLPYAVDLMALSMGAGLDFPGAVRQVIEKSSMPDDPLVEEFSLIMQNLNLGRTRKDALLLFGQRCASTGVLEFVNAVIQAEERGTPLAAVLSIQATVSRQRRSAAAEESAAKAAVKLTGPLVVVLFVVLILMLGPAVISLQDTM